MEYLYAHPVFSLLQGAFTIWMLVDAYRRQAESFWFYIILFVPVLGAWGYFFAVKARDFRNLSLHLPAFLQGRPSLDELHFRCEQMPTFATHLALAERLMEEEEYEEAISHLVAAGKTEPDHSRLLYARASCHARLGQLDEARPLLERLVEKDPRWSDYAGWYLLVETHDEANDHTGSLEVCRRLVKLAPTLRHQCLVAERLLDEGQAAEAENILQRGLQEYQYLGGNLRRRNHRWAGVARRLLKRAEAG